MELNDDKIKVLIRQYQSNPSAWASFRDEFRKEIELYVYQFPRLAYKKSLDVCSDFYLYVLERVESIIKNYPLQDSLLFKTWFNHVLKNQFFNFLYYRNKTKVTELSLEDFENDICIELFEHEELQFGELMEGLKQIDMADRILIKFYYMPETLSAEDIRAAASLFRLTIRELLDIQTSAIRAQNDAIDHIRETSSKLGKINKQLRETKIALYYHKSDVTPDYGKKNELLGKIARLEVSKNKALRDLEAPNKNVFSEFVRLFKNNHRAKLRLQIAQRKLKYEILQIKKKAMMDAS